METFYLRKWLLLASHLLYNIKETVQWFHMIIQFTHNKQTEALLSVCLGPL